MSKKVIVSICFLITTLFSFAISYAANNNTESDFPDYTTLREVDKATFNEYRYYIVREYFKLKESFDLNGKIDKTIVSSIYNYAKTGNNYLPDSLINERYLNDLSIAVQRGIKEPNSEVNYLEIVDKIKTYLEDVNVQAIKGTIDITPKTGNAPLNVTLRGNLTDPTGTVIPSNNYIWWMTKGGQRTIIGRGVSINYTFKEEGNFTVFLDARSNHKNAKGYTDVVSFQTRAVIEVKEKVATLFINVNSLSLKDKDEVKFTPEEGNYGLLFDATGSTPTGGAKFVRTEWDFGNGVTRKYDGAPRLERVIYAREGGFSASLKLITNEGRTIERKFTVYIHDPIATINTDKTEGFIGDKFSFSTKSSVKEENLTFSWNIIDINNDKIIKQSNGSVFSYVFTDKGRFNVQLRVKDMYGEEDVDTQLININSREPIAEYSYSVPNPNKPNTILLDGTRSYDPDFSDTGKLKYIWTINGEIVKIDSLDSKGAIGYYTFDSIGEHSVVLEVIDSDDISGIKSDKIKVDSILSVDLFTYPRVIQRGGFIKFVASSQNGRYYDWDFGDGDRKSGSSDKIDHIYQKSGIYEVKLTVKDVDGNTNEIRKSVYVGEANTPYAHIGVDFGGTDSPIFDNNACNGGAYIVDRVKPVYFRSKESLNVDGETTGLTYSWKIGNDKFVSSQDASEKFDEVGCYPIKLTVKSDKTGKTSTTDTYVKVQNLKPKLTSLQTTVQDPNSDPVVINVQALGAADEDGVIQSYLWYYYTDSDVEPQDFRITNLPSTTFVIPKITGNYYFVLVMRDNNDERYNSEEATGNKYFVTLAGDNINTPIIDFKSNKQTLMIGEEVNFNASAKNVLGQDISSKATYSWDFDGDGFYDKESTTGTISYKYEASGTYYAKVKVKYKGMTNVRNIEINVSNVLSPDFEYISIGNKYIFFNTSLGEFKDIVWDMGDGNKVEGKNYFVYSFSNGSSTNKVDLKISEGTNAKNKTKEVTKNMKNMIDVTREKGLVVFTYPELQNDKITLTTQGGKVYVYLGESKGSFKNYGVDFDISTDSDLNGAKDDDVDNISESSYNDGGVVEVKLNDQKTQTIRVFLLDASGKVVESKDIVVEKTYITQETIDLTKVTFNGITEAELSKVEKLKTFVQNLPQENRLKGMEFIQKLQENWFDLTEKTKIILDFVTYIDSLSLPNGSEIITLLESFLVEGQQDQSVRNMAYNVVKNLIPQELTGYEDIISNLDLIKASPEKLEENKVFGKEILESIKDTDLITNEDKVILKAQLQVLIYGGVDKIPEEVKEETQDTSSSNKIIGLLSGTAKFVGIFFALLLVVVIGFFLWFKISNKNPNQGLQDFIIEKTSFDNDGTHHNEKVKDVFANPLASTNEPKDVLSNTFSHESKKEEETKVEETPKAVEEVKEEQVPDWLKGSMPTNTEETKVEETLKVVEEVKEEQVPDWLKGSMPTTTEETKVEETPKVVEEVKEEQVPDWLKGSMPTTTEETKVEETPKVVEEVKEEEIPDWLKGSMPTNTEETKVEETPKVVEEVKDEIIVSESTQDKPKKTKKVSSGDKENDKSSTTKVKKSKPNEDSDEKNKVNSDGELWNDGMEIPDWLKQSNNSTDEKKSKDDFWTIGSDEDNKKV